MKIILFEDTQEFEERLQTAINAALGNKGTALIFPLLVSSNGPSVGPEEPRPYEVQIEEELANAEYKDPSLIVADCDLSKSKQYGGLSEPTVRRVADKLAIPECGYARGEREENEFLSGAELREGRIVVSLQGGDEQFAKQVVSIAEGFKFIAKKLPEALQVQGKKSPGKVLATILDKPEYSEKIALYASGDQNRLASVLRAGTGEEGIRRLACMFGYWLWDSVLRFPGVLVNEIAASSYLNIKQESFSTPDIKALFNKALYNGPFAAAKGQFWWRGLLDDIILECSAADGRTYAIQKLHREIPQSECCEDNAKPAGYYCVINKQPVSLENSKAGLTWFPRGADLSRISSKKYAEIVPWL